MNRSISLNLRALAPAKALLIPVFVAALAGCGNKNSAQVAQDNSKGNFTLASTNADLHGVTFRLGYGKGGSLEIVRRQGKLAKRLAAKGVSLQWVNFPMGPQMMEAIGAGSLDLGSCASTPPIFAQAANVDFAYVASIPPGQSNGAILIPKNSPLKSVRDLKGKTVAFQPGSIWQYDLIKLLEANGLKYEDVKTAKMPPADASSAFNSGSIDAWIQGEPYVTLAQRKSGARILANTSKIGNTGGFFLGARSTLEKYPELYHIALEEIQGAGRWAKANPHQAALLTAERVGLDVPTVETMIRKGNNTHFDPVDERIVKAQQDQADLFFKIGVLPSKVDVSKVVLTPKQYAQVLPGGGAPSSTTRFAANSPTGGTP